MLIKRLSLIICLIGCFGIAKAQFVNDYLGAADNYFASGDYFSAAQYYEKYMVAAKSKTKKEGFQPYSVAAKSNKKITIVSNSREKVIYNLAESYRKLHYHEKALPYYAEANNFDTKAFPLAKFYYGSTLRSLSKYDEAAVAFNSFLTEYAEKDNYAVTAAREIENIGFIKQQLLRKDLKKFSVEKNAGLNAEGGSYAPVWVNENTLWFTSTRPQGIDKTKSTTNRIYQVEYNAGNAGAVSLTTMPQLDGLQQGVTSITPDGNTVYLTRWKVAGDKKMANIYVSKKQNGNWEEPVSVTALNVEGSSTQQPFVMPDGKNIVFTSNRPGGLGGLDLWMASLDNNGNIGTPINMGAKVNTAFDEQAASYHAASKTFIYSTNGRVGMGGYDFFYNTGSLDNLSGTKNFGYPVNSEKDDLYLISKESAANVLENVIMSSDRDAACCLELYSLHKIKTMKQISGLVLDCENNQPLSGVKVTIEDTINGKIIAEKTTDATGTYSFTIEDYQPLKATGANTGYFNSSIKITGPSDDDQENFKSSDLCLTLIKVEPVKMDNVYYDFNKASLQKESFASLDKLVQLLNDNPTLEIEINAYTDSKGKDDFNQKLSDARAKSVVNYLVSKGISESRLKAIGLGETMPITDNTNADGTDNPEGRQQNRRTEFKVIKK